MSIATLFRRKPAIQPTPLARHSLALNISYPLDRDVQKLVDEFDADVTAFDANVAILHADREALLSSMRQLTLDEIANKARDLNERRKWLAAEKCRLMWGRFALLPQLLPHAQKHLDEKTDEVEDAIADARHRLDQEGVSVDSFPGYRDNRQAAEFLLHRHCEQQPEVLAAQGAKNRAVDAVENLKAQIPSLPSREAVRINWQPEPADLVGTIAKALELGALAQSPEPSFASAETHLLREVGLENSGLIERHVAVVRELAALLPCMPRPLKNGINKKNMQQVVALLRQLPATQPVQQFLHETEKTN